MSRGKLTPSFDVQAVEAFGTAFRKVVPRKNSSGVNLRKIRFFCTTISNIDIFCVRVKNRLLF